MHHTVLSAFPRWDNFGYCWPRPRVPNLSIVSLSELVAFQQNVKGLRGQNNIFIHNMINQILIISQVAEYNEERWEI